METTLKMYTEIMDFGIADYVTEANHRIADIYATLSDDLMNSQRPNGLDALPAQARLKKMMIQALLLASLAKARAH